MASIKLESETNGKETLYRISCSIEERNEPLVGLACIDDREDDPDFFKAYGHLLQLSDHFKAMAKKMLDVHNTRKER